MKVIQLITAFQLGGAEKVAFDIVSNLNKNHEFELISIFKNDDNFSKDLKKNLEANNIKWRELGLTKINSKFKYLNLLYSSFALLFYIMKNKINIIHSHTDLPDFVLAIILKLNKVNKNLKIVRTIHNTELWSTHFKIGKLVESSFENDHVVFISNDVEKAYKSLRNRYSLKESDNRYFISNGVDFEKYDLKTKNSVLDSLNITLDKNIINLLFVGRLVEQKGFDLIVDLLHILDKEDKKRFHIYAFGSGELEKLVEKNMPITIYKPITNINEIYRYFDYLVMPSRFEGLPLVSLEASASNLPVIASYASGLKETLPMDWELFFKNESVEDLKNLLINILNNKYDKTLLSSKSNIFVKENFDLKSTVEKYNQLYNKLEIK
jgi:glycosyltransferase involved in cell wall biosynthesis